MTTDKAQTKLDDAGRHLAARRPGPALFVANHGALLAGDAGNHALRQECLALCAQARAAMRGQGTLPLEVVA